MRRMLSQHPTALETEAYTKIGFEIVPALEGHECFEPQSRAA